MIVERCCQFMDYDESTKMCQFCFQKFTYRPYGIRIKVPEADWQKEFGFQTGGIVKGIIDHDALDTIRYGGYSEHFTLRGGKVLIVDTFTEETDSVWHTIWTVFIVAFTVIVATYLVAPHFVTDVCRNLGVLHLWELLTVQSNP